MFLHARIFEENCYRRCLNDMGIIVNRYSEKYI